MKNYTVPVAGLLLIVLTGLQHRQQSRAEAQSAAALEQAAEQLEQDVPLKIGDWAGEDVPVEDRALRVGEIAGCVARNYTHSLTGEIAQMLLMCGSPGPISAHTPDICFAGNGYEMISEPKRIALRLPSGEAEFWWADFQKGSVGQQSTLRTFWSWKADADWKISNHPRLEFAHRPVLYKLYVASPVNPSEGASTDQPNTEFLKALLREVHPVPPGSAAEELEL